MAIVRTWLLVCCVLGGLLTTQAEAAPKHPNVVLVLIDDMGLMDTSVPFLTDEEGKPKKYPLNDYYRTPNMQRLAKQGIRFSNFYAMSVCSPTRVSIMTGMTSARHRTTNWIRPESNNAGEYGPDWQWEGITPEHVTLPELLKQAGYRTIHAGKAHFGPNDTYGELPQNFGFDVNIAGRAIGAPATYYGTKNFGVGQKRRSNRAVYGLDEYHGKEIYLTEALTREMNKQITKSVEQGKPFFAYMSHYAVHAPFNPDPRFVGNYSEKSKNAQAFASMIEGIDKSLGDILDHVQELGVAEDTLVLFVGDNGSDAPLGPTHEIACAAPLRGKKGTHYEGGMRVPMIAAWAKPNAENAWQQQLSIPPNVILEDFGAVYDLFPTILKLAEVEVPKGIDGMDLKPLLTGNRGALPDRPFLMHFPHQHRSSYFTVYRDGDWKLIYHWRPKQNSPRYELFNLAEDYNESKNLAASQPEKLTAMVKAMTTALEEAQAQYPLADDKKTPLQPELP